MTAASTRRSTVMFAAARVAQDRKDGEALGVEGTPTLSLNGKELELSNGQQLMDEINAAIAAS